MYYLTCTDKIIKESSVTLPSRTVLGHLQQLVDLLHYTAYLTSVHVR